MERRTFLQALAAAKALALLRPAPALADLPKAKITRVRIYEPPELNPLFNQSNMVVDRRDRHRDHRDRRGRRQGHARAVRRDADRQEPVPHRGDLAGGLHRLVLPARPREGARARRSRHGALGHQGQGARRFRCTSSWAAPRATTASATRPAGAVRRASPADAKISLKERARATMEAGYRAFRMGAGDVPIGDVFDTRAAVRQDRAGLQGSARRGRARTATGASTSTSASISTTRCAAARRSRSSSRSSSRTRCATSTRSRTSRSCGR